MTVLLDSVNVIIGRKCPNLSDEHEHQICITYDITVSPRIGRKCIQKKSHPI